MAQFPCDLCELRYRGAQQTMYPALLHHAVSFRYKQRMCPECFEMANNWLQDHTLPVDVLQTSSLCELCEVDPGALAFFCTVYARGEERADYYAYFCVPCALRYLLPVFFGPQARAEAPFSP